tara:strand:- start:140 stop:280 length:141 start_codon:yes stop_codon:yes gene_type:complete
MEEGAYSMRSLALPENRQAAQPGIVLSVHQKHAFLLFFTLHIHPLW